MPPIKERRTFVARDRVIDAFRNRSRVGTVIGIESEPPEFIEVNWDDGYRHKSRYESSLEMYIPAGIRETIEITYKGDSTFVHIKREGKVFTGTAKRDPQDKYDAEIGFQTAYKRARDKQLGKEEKKHEPKKKEFKVGDRVSSAEYGNGRIIVVDTDGSCGVEHDNPTHWRHTCRVEGRSGYCAWVSNDKLRHI